MSKKRANLAESFITHNLARGLSMATNRLAMNVTPKVREILDKLRDTVALNLTEFVEYAILYQWEVMLGEELPELAAMRKHISRQLRQREIAFANFRRRALPGAPIARDTRHADDVSDDERGEH